MYQIMFLNEQGLEVANHNQDEIIFSGSAKAICRGEAITVNTLVIDLNENQVILKDYERQTSIKMTYQDFMNVNFKNIHYSKGL